MRTLSPIGMTLSSRSYPPGGSAAPGLHRSAMAMHDFDERDNEEEATVLRTLPPELRPIPRPPALDTTQSRAARRARQRAAVSGEHLLAEPLPSGAAPQVAREPGAPPVARALPPDVTPLIRALKPPAKAFSDADTLYDEEELTDLRPRLGDTVRAGLVGAGVATFGLLMLAIWVS